MRYKLTRFFSQQFDAIGDALIPLLFAIAVTALVVWLLTRWRYRRIIAQIEADQAAREAQAAVSWDSVAASADTDVAEESRGDSRARRKALRVMTNAIDGAELAIRGGSRDALESALPNMWLALATARNTFELPIPAQGDDPRANLTMGKLWLEHVRPPLRAGDDDAARRRAVEFLRDNGLQQA